MHDDEGKIVATAVRGEPISAMRVSIRALLSELGSGFSHSLDVIIHRNPLRNTRALRSREIMASGNVIRTIGNAAPPLVK